MLYLGRRTAELFNEQLPKTFLIVDDGQIIDALPLPARRKITVFDFQKHAFNPLKGMDYRRARDFLTVMDAVFPEGANTLTKKNSNFVMLKALLDKPRRLDTLIDPTDEPATIDAFQKIQTLLMSPVLNRVLLHPTNFPLDGVILARLDRTVLGDFDCFVLANLLISLYKGHVLIPDFGFYACPFHLSLIRQRRLTVGLNFLDEVDDKLRKALLLQETIPARCLYDDAETLAMFKGYSRGTTGFSDYVASCMGG